MTTMWQLVSAYRWPLFSAGLLLMSVTAQGILVWVATRPDVPPPLTEYYERSLAWDADAATLAASRALGFSVDIDVPSGPELDLSELRPVDITVRDRDGAPVTGLSGRLVAIRPADTRLNNAAELVALPQTPGRYRTLARLPAAGLWELDLDTHLGASRFLYSTRVEVVREVNP